MQRTIKSFVLRTGRVSHRQQVALDQWLSDYTISDSDSPICFEKEFGRIAKTMVEIGFGMGASLCSMAKLQPDINFLGIEVHLAGIGSLVASLHDEGIDNVRIKTKDAVEIFQRNIADDSLDGVQIFFPDPWPKKRHHKRRLIQKEFVHLLVKKIKQGGFIHCATDWEEYAYHMLTVLAADSALQPLSSEGDFSKRPDSRPLTKFEERGQRLGHGVWDLIFIKS
ncbi:MAG: tRNA (guanosine(46)-N7)-methyltransferase TrmB [Legionellales bacterium]|nr:tRNA (guanosine(46)-N7)-methyltransferase TrmB [Legionellales bacterium]